MKRYFGVIVAFVFVVGAIVFSYRKWDEKTKDTARELAFSKLQVDYAERVAWIRVNPNEKGYKDEVDTFFRWYFKEVNEQINKFGYNRNHDDYLRELDERAGKPGKNEKLDEKKEVYETVKKQFEVFKSNQYAPLWTSTQNGIRFDIVSANLVQSGGESKVRYQVVVWGLPREQRQDDRGTKRVTTNGSFAIAWKMFDEKMKLHSEMNASGDPSNKIDWGERYIKFFPPGVVFGHYDVDLMPAEVKAVEIAFTVSARALTGGEIRSEHLWKLDAPAEWKLKTGETWKGAGESVRPEEEINARVEKPGKK
jgi:hypothetical protein